jgi:serine/threonine-protein kinase HipA
MTSSLPENRYSVWIKNRRAGTLHQRGDYTWFRIDDDYAADPERPVLGLQFEQDLEETHSSHMRVPPWFSNLLPEGILRDWIADERGVSADREMELLAQVGHDLPGAVQVLSEDDETPADEDWDPSKTAHAVDPTEEPPEWRFSLAGVSLKFSMLDRQDRLTLPAFGELGDTIVKFPDKLYPEVPRNEFVMMSLAKSVGIDVPAIKLVHRDTMHGVPDVAWPESEEWAYAIRRFDRDDNRDRVHIEDLAQVRNFYAGDKYQGNFETVAALLYRGRDTESLREFARRLAFDVLIGNGDAHLKNWSLVYRDPRIPTISPAYDLVATAWYGPGGTPENLALKFGKSRRFEAANMLSFAVLERRLKAYDAALLDVVEELIQDVKNNWPSFADQLSPIPEIRNGIGGNIAARSKSLMVGLSHARELRP